MADANYSTTLQHDSKLKKTMKFVTPMISTKILFRKGGGQSIQYSGSTNLTSHASLTLLLQLRNREEVTAKK